MSAGLPRSHARRAAVQALYQTLVNNIVKLLNTDGQFMGWYL